MLVTGEHRRERSAEGQWCGADLPGLQMMTMVMTMVMTTMLFIAMMMKDYGKVQICIYMHIAYTISMRICIICAIICFKCSSKNINVAGWQNLAAFRWKQKWQ